MRLKIIQHAEAPEFRKLLEQIAPHHRHQAEILGYDYAASYSGDHHPHWMKAALALDAVRDGYDEVVWLDADTFWLGSPLNPIFSASFGMTFHWHIEQGKSHYNAGVFFYRHEKSSTTLEDWLSFEKTTTSDQDVLNEHFLEHIAGIDHQWNSMCWLPSYRSDSPKILAWHGAPNRIARMQVFIDNLPPI